MKKIIVITDKDGNWSKPVTGNLAVTAAAGLLPGSTWNWSLSRTNKKSN